MLVQLTIQNVILITHQEIFFDKGLTIFSGESGSGKTAVVQSLGLCLGIRADPLLIRAQENQACVYAVFEEPGNAELSELLREHGIVFEDQLVLKRVLFRDGRSRAYINDVPVSVTLLRTVGANLVEIVGQHVDRSYSDPQICREMLDQFAKLSEELSALQHIHRQYVEVLERYETVQSEYDKALKELEFTTHALEELTALDVKPNEEQALEHLRINKSKIARLVQDLNNARVTLVDDSALKTVLATTLRKLERTNVDDLVSLQACRLALEQVFCALDVAAQEVTRLESELNYDQVEHERIEERLFELRAASRKYSVPISDLPGLKEQFSKDCAYNEGIQNELQQVQSKCETLKRFYQEHALDISKKRTEAAVKFEQELQVLLNELDLKHAKVKVDVHFEPQKVSPYGGDQVQFLLKTHNDGTFAPLLKVASGGELSRIILSIKTLLGSVRKAKTFMLDEVDTGVSGATSSRVGDYLKSLSLKQQVITLTHAPQLAAKGNHHLLVKKIKNEGLYETVIVRLNEKDRCEEVARMLSGKCITEVSLKAASQLFEHT